VFFGGRGRGRRILRELDKREGTLCSSIYHNNNNSESEFSNSEHSRKGTGHAKPRKQTSSGIWENWNHQCRSLKASIPTSEFLRTHDFQYASDIHFPYLIFVSLGRATREGTQSESPTARRTGFTELYALDSNTSLPPSPYTSPDCGPATGYAQCLSINEEDGIISEETLIQVTYD